MSILHSTFTIGIPTAKVESDSTFNGLGKYSQFKSVHDGDSNAGDLLSTCTLSSHGSHTGVAWAHLLQGLGHCSF